MSDTKTSPNNAKVEFRGKPVREKPRSLSKAAKRAHKRGLISDKQMEKMQGGE